VFDFIIFQRQVEVGAVLDSYFQVLLKFCDSNNISLQLTMLGNNYLKLWKHFLCIQCIVMVFCTFHWSGNGSQCPKDNLMLLARSNQFGISYYLHAHDPQLYTATSVNRRNIDNIILEQCLQSLCSWLYPMVFILIQSNQVQCSLTLSEFQYIMAL